MWLRQHWVSLLGLFLSALYIYLQLRQWQQHGDDLMPVAASIFVTVALWATLLSAIWRYRRDARQSEALGSRLKNLEYEHEVQLNHARKTANEEHEKWKREETEKWKSETAATIEKLIADHRQEIEGFKTNPPPDLFFAIKGLMGPGPMVSQGPTPAHLQVLAPEARYLIDELERIKDWNDKEKPELQIDLLYPLKGDQFGERSTWKWQHEELLKWRTAYDRFCESCNRAGVGSGMPRFGSAVNFSKVLRILSDAERGIFPDSNHNA
jgi:hypothetical protein